MTLWFFITLLLFNKMLNQIKVIKAINNSLEPFLIKGSGGVFYLSNYKSPYVYRLRITENFSKAFDDHGNYGNIVNVVKWFNDYWLFVEITFQQNKGVLITLSVFQGDETDQYKNQLFRAEWDDYGENNASHPQPHWHILNNKSVEYAVSSFEEIVTERNHDTFVGKLKEEKNKLIDLSKFHFAMNGDWNNTSTHIHPIDNEASLAKWFGGLLSFLKTELEYLDRKRGIFL